MLTVLAHWADSVSKSRCPSIINVCLCHTWKPASRWTGDFWSVANNWIPLDIFMFCCFNNYFAFKKLGFWVFANQPTVHNGGVSRGRLCGCGCWREWQVTCSPWHVTHNTLHRTVSQKIPPPPGCRLLCHTLSATISKTLQRANHPGLFLAVMN